MPGPAAVPAGIAIAGLVVGAVGVIAGFLGSKKASKAAKEQAKLEAEAESQLTRERIYQLGKEERQLYGDTVARYAGGGVLSSFGTTKKGTDYEPVSSYSAEYGVIREKQGTGLELIGSAKSVINEQAASFARERSITQRVGATKVAQGLARGKATADAYKYQGYSNAATGISNILANYAAMS
jgi:hypothetical protein